MQEPGRMAQGSGSEPCSVQTPSHERAEGMALPKIESGRAGDGCGEGVSFMVLLRRPNDQGQMGFDDTSSNDPGGHVIHGEWPGQDGTPGIHFPKLGRLTAFEITTVLRRRSGLGLDKSEIAAETFKIAEVRLIPYLRQSEICFLLRRRLDETQKACADEMGISRYWFNMMEQGKAPCKTLVEYWSRHAG